MKRARNDRGATLVEILVALAILALVAGVVATALRAARDRPTGLAAPVGGRGAGPTWSGSL